MIAYWKVQKKQNQKQRKVLFYILSCIYFLSSIIIIAKFTPSIPINNPTLQQHFTNTLQFQHPSWFVVKKSKIKNAGYGLFFNGFAEKWAYLCGYPGIIKDYDLENNKSNYSCLVNSIPKKIIDATSFANKLRRLNFFSNITFQFIYFII